jgi:methylglutaconyl-CoA hydratase
MSALTITNQGAIRTITLNRPDVRNAFNDEVITELKAAFVDAGQAADVRCVVLAAEGPAFCAGADLNWQPCCVRFMNAPNQLSLACKAMCLRAVWAWSLRAT